MGGGRKICSPLKGTVCYLKWASCFGHPRQAGLYHPSCLEENLISLSLLPLGGIPHSFPFLHSFLLSLPPTGCAWGEEPSSLPLSPLLPYYCGEGRKEAPRAGRRGGFPWENIVSLRPLPGGIDMWVAGWRKEAGQATGFSSVPLLLLLVLGHFE